MNDTEQFNNFVEYLALQLALSRWIHVKQDGGKEADAIRDAMDKPYYDMDEGYRDKAGRIAEILNECEGEI